MTQFAGIKFHYAVQGTKSVTNSAISHGLGVGIIIENSQNIKLENNVIHDFLDYGIRAKGSSSNFQVHGNVVNWIRPSNKPQPPYMVWAGNCGGMSFEDASAFTVKNNIVAGTWHWAFRLPAYMCGADPVHTGNVAHSISGYGVIVNEGAGSCSEFSDFKAYKTRIGTLHMGGGTGSATNVIHSIVSIDSIDGIMAFGSSGGHVEVRDSVIYGDQDMPNRDCPNADRCGACTKKRGIWIPTFGGHSTSVAIAPDKLKKMFDKNGAWTGTSMFKDLTFIGFDSRTNSCGQS